MPSLYIPHVKTTKPPTRYRRSNGQKGKTFLDLPYRAGGCLNVVTLCCIQEVSEYQKSDTQCKAVADTASRYPPVLVMTGEGAESFMWCCFY